MKKARKKVVKKKVATKRAATKREAKKPLEESPSWLRRQLAAEKETVAKLRNDVQAIQALLEKMRGEHRLEVAELTQEVQTLKRERAQMLQQFEHASEARREVDKARNEKEKVYGEVRAELEGLKQANAILRDAIGRDEAERAKLVDSVNRMASTIMELVFEREG